MEPLRHWTGFGTIKIYVVGDTVYAGNKTLVHRHMLPITFGSRNLSGTLGFSGMLLLASLFLALLAIYGEPALESGRVVMFGFTVALAALALSGVATYLSYKRFERRWDQFYRHNTPPYESEIEGVYESRPRLVGHELIYQLAKRLEAGSDDPEILKGIANLSAALECGHDIPLRNEIMRYYSHVNWPHPTKLKRENFECLN